ncbi:MAG: tryptophan 7-halogenase [Verrucomicrobiales bacterium]|nr:tryptophan 7-halogenase [Verrucomicrobiales bacterium]
MNFSCDIAIVGSGFAGSLLAMIAHRLGRSVILLERGRHPRFVIGESSTPLTNLLLEDLASRYDLPRIAGLSKWGTWQRQHPRIACGLKRGFTFYHHEFGKAFEPRENRTNELLVGASPRDEMADTHWYRPDFDHFLVREAQALGVEYLDEVALMDAQFDRAGGRIEGERAKQRFSINARLVVDASGPRGFLHRALGLPEAKLPNLPATHGLYTHFTDVRRFADLIADSYEEVPPYPPDNAALHHIFDGGWIWVLRFNNGITSAGAVVTEQVANRFNFREGVEAWQRLLHELPSVRAQFLDARPTIPFTYAPRLSFRSGVVTGPGWLLLPSAAGFVDPLLSTGFPLTLLGVNRLARIIEEAWGTEEFETRLAACAQQTTDELLVTERLVAGLYAVMNDFPVFQALSLLYFAAVSFSEAAWRRNKPNVAPAFLLHDRPGFGRGLRECCDLALRAANGRLSDPPRTELLNKILRTISPIDVAGLSDRTRRNWYPAPADDVTSSLPMGDGLVLSENSRKSEPIPSS